MSLNELMQMDRDPDDSALAGLKALFAQRKKVLEQIQYAEDNLKLLKGELEKIEQREIPDIFNAAGIGSKGIDIKGLGVVSVVPDVSVSIEGRKGSEERELAENFLFHWLSVNDMGDVIKEGIKIPQPAQELKDKLMTMGVLYTSEKSVHPQTLKKIIKDYINDGGDVGKLPGGLRLYTYNKLNIKKG